MIRPNPLTNTVYAAPTCPFCSCKASHESEVQNLATPDGAVREMRSYRCTNGHAYLLVGGEQARTQH